MIQSDVWKRKTLSLDMDGCYDTNTHFICSDGFPSSARSFKSMHCCLLFVLVLTFNNKSIVPASDVNFMHRGRQIAQMLNICLLPSFIIVWRVLQFSSCKSCHSSSAKKIKFESKQITCEASKRLNSTLHLLYLRTNAAITDHYIYRPPWRHLFVCIFIPSYFGSPKKCLGIIMHWIHIR